MIVTTKSGSVYTLDTENQTVTRTSTAPMLYVDGLGAPLVLDDRPIQGTPYHSFEFRKFQGGTEHLFILYPGGRWTLSTEIVDYDCEDHRFGPEPFDPSPCEECGKPYEGP
jgi:hypothetical protein